MHHKIGLLLPLLLLALLTRAQSYQVGAIPFDPDTTVGGTNYLLIQDDIWGDAVALPFPFCFHDSLFDSIWIGSNGLVTFTPQAPSTYCIWPISQPAPNLGIPPYTIMSPWHEINPSFGGSTKIHTWGLAPYRWVTISYINCAMFSCTGLHTTQQIKLFETSNVIEMHITDKPVCPTWNGGYAIQGLQINDSLAYVVQGRDYPTQWAAQHDAVAFTPTGPCNGVGANYNLQGKVFADLNSNCVADTLIDYPIANRAIVVNGGQTYTWTNSQGKYALVLPPGVHTISESISPPFVPSSCNPTVQQVTMNGLPLPPVDFADSANFSCTDLQAGISVVALRRCDPSELIQLTYSNNSIVPDSNVVLTVYLHDSIQPTATSIPYVQTGPNAYSFHLGALPPFAAGTITIWASVGCEPAGTMHCLTTEITGDVANECNPSNNSDYECLAISAPFDPNSKHLADQDFETKGYVTRDTIANTDTLLYRIDFQNLGTTYAEDVEIRDEINTNRLDISTLEIVSASHPYQYAIAGSTLVVRFEDIFLPDSTTDEEGSHGLVRFRIRQVPGNPPGTAFLNQARIYFDHEPPVLTNAAWAKIALPTGVDASMPNAVKIYPNPGGDRAFVSCTGFDGAELKCYDWIGRQMLATTLAADGATIDATTLSPGLYVLEIEYQGKRIFAGKWIHQ